MSIVVCSIFNVNYHLTAVAKICVFYPLRIFQLAFQIQFHKAIKNQVFFGSIHYNFSFINTLFPAGKILPSATLMKGIPFMFSVNVVTSYTASVALKTKESWSRRVE